MGYVCVCVCGGVPIKSIISHLTVSAQISKNLVLVLNLNYLFFLLYMWVQFYFYWLVGRKETTITKSEIFLLLTTVKKMLQKKKRNTHTHTKILLGLSKKDCQTPVSMPRRPLWEVPLLLLHRHNGSGIPASSAAKKGKMIYGYIDHHTNIFSVLICTKLSYSF